MSDYTRPHKLEWLTGFVDDLSGRLEEHIASKVTIPDEVRAGILGLGEWEEPDVVEAELVPCIKAVIEQFFVNTYRFELRPTDLEPFTRTSHQVGQPYTRYREQLVRALREVAELADPEGKHGTQWQQLRIDLDELFSDDSVVLGFDAPTPGIALLRLWEGSTQTADRIEKLPEPVAKGPTRGRRSGGPKSSSARRMAFEALDQIFRFFFVGGEDWWRGVDLVVEDLSGSRLEFFGFCWAQLLESMEVDWRLLRSDHRWRACRDRGMSIDGRTVRWKSFAEAPQQAMCELEAAIENYCDPIADALSAQSADVYRELAQGASDRFRHHLRVRGLEEYFGKDDLYWGTVPPITRGLIPDSDSKERH